MAKQTTVAERKETEERQGEMDEEGGGGGAETLRSRGVTRGLEGESESERWREDGEQRTVRKL